MVLFGQSAGAFNTFAIATMNEAPSLISAAIMESGGGSDFASVAEAQPWNDVFLTGLGCQPSDVRGSLLHHFYGFSTCLSNLTVLL
jgi:para-nitrobenzyl esterase